MDINFWDFWFKYFYAICVLSGLLTTFITYRRMKAINQGVTNYEINSFIKWCGICVTVPFMLLQIFQLLGNYRTVFYIFLLDFSNGFYILGFISIILFWTLVLYLVTIKSGAEIIAKYNKAFRNMPADKTKVKMFIVLMVFAGLIAVLFGNQIMGGAFANVEANGILKYNETVKERNG